MGIKFMTGGNTVYVFNLSEEKALDTLQVPYSTQSFDNEISNLKNKVANKDAKIIKKQKKLNQLQKVLEEKNKLIKELEPIAPKFKDIKIGDIYRLEYNGDEYVCILSTLGEGIVLHSTSGNYAGVPVKENIKENSNLMVNYGKLSKIKNIDTILRCKSL